MAKMLPEINLTKSVRNIWQENLLLDYTIEVEDKEFRVHKVIMASVSDYFKVMLTGGMVESQTDRVKIQGLNALAVSNIIDYIYRNEISGTKASPEDFLACAVYLQIPSAIEAATQLLNQEVNEKNCFDILRTFQTYSLKDAAAITEQYIKDHVCEVLEVNKVVTMSWQTVATLVELWDKSEWDLFLMVKEWAEVDFENRKQHMTDIFSNHLNFHLFSPAVIDDIRKMRIYTESEENEESWHGLLDKAIDYQNLPMHRKVNDKPPLRSKQSVVCFVKEEDAPDIMYKWEKNNQYTSVIDIPPLPELPNGAAAVIEVDNFLFVCGHCYDDGNQDWYIFDPRTLVWTEIASFNTPRSDFALVYDLKYIYAMGGLIELDTGSETVTDSIERYDLEANTWTTIPSKLPVPLQKHKACCWLLYIFVTGGCETTETDEPHSQRLYACDRSKDPLNWIERSPIPHDYPCQFMDVMRFNNEEVIVTMNEYLVMQYYNPRTDQWTSLDCLGLVASKLELFGGGSMLADTKDNSLYLLRFHYTNEDELPEGLSVKWTLSADSETITEHIIEGLPYWEDEGGDNGENQYTFGVLVFPPP